MFKIYDENPLKKEIYLRLVQDGSIIKLIAVDPFGKKIDAGVLLSFYSDGSIHRNPAINPEIGIKLNKKGEIFLDVDIEQEKADGSERNEPCGFCGKIH